MRLVCLGSCSVLLAGMLGVSCGAQGEKAEESGIGDGADEEGAGAGGAAGDEPAPAVRTPDGSGGERAGGEMAGDGPTGSGGASSDGPAAGGAGNDSPADGSAGNESSDGNDDPAGGSDTIGTIQVMRTLGLRNAVSVVAAFDVILSGVVPEPDAEGETPVCAWDYDGDCGVYSCRTSEPEEPAMLPDELPELVRLEAGTITISSDVDDFTATGSPDDEARYVFTQEGALTGDGLLTISASGGNIDAFEATLPFPLAPFLTSHSATGEAGLPYEISVPRDEDLVIGWDARGTAEAIQIIVESSEPTTPTIGCRFDAEAGTGSIAASILGQLASGTEIHLLAVRSGSVTTPQGNVTLRSAFEMYSPDRTVYPYFVLE